MTLSFTTNESKQWIRKNSAGFYNIVAAYDIEFEIDTTFAEHIINTGIYAIMQRNEYLLMQPVGIDIGDIKTSVASCFYGGDNVEIELHFRFYKPIKGFGTEDNDGSIKILIQKGTPLCALFKANRVDAIQ